MRVTEVEPAAPQTPARSGDAPLDSHAAWRAAAAAAAPAGAWCFAQALGPARAAAALGRQKSSLLRPRRWRLSFPCQLAAREGRLRVKGAQRRPQALTAARPVTSGLPERLLHPVQAVLQSHQRVGTLQRSAEPAQSPPVRRRFRLAEPAPARLHPRSPSPPEAAAARDAHARRALRCLRGRLVERPEGCPTQRRQLRRWTPSPQGRGTRGWSARILLRPPPPRRTTMTSAIAAEKVEVVLRLIRSHHTSARHPNLGPCLSAWTRFRAGAAEYQSACFARSTRSADGVSHQPEAGAGGCRNRRLRCGRVLPLQTTRRPCEKGACASPGGLVVKALQLTTSFVTPCSCADRRRTLWRTQAAARHREAKALHAVAGS